MIYDIIAYSKPTDVPQNVGSVIKKLRVSASEEDTLELVSIVNNFFTDVDLAALNISEPALTLIGTLSKVTTNEEVNDILGTLRFYGIYFSIVELKGLSEEATEDPEVQSVAYLTLPKSYKPETYSVPVLYEGTCISFKTVPTLGIMLLEVLKQMPLPTYFSKFTSIKELLQFYSTVASDDSSSIRITDTLKALESLGYSYLGLIM